MLDVKQKARLSWHCRRGMLELDLFLQNFMQHQVDHLSDAQIETFDLLLSHTDPELLAWFMGHEDPADKGLYELVALIRAMH
jgi:antitoxin CptB